MADALPGLTVNASRQSRARLTDLPGVVIWSVTSVDAEQRFACVEAAGSRRRSGVRNVRYAYGTDRSSWEARVSSRRATVPGDRPCDAYLPEPGSSRPRRSVSPPPRTGATRRAPLSAPGRRRPRS
jgi:hypothetical protein